VDSEIVGRDNEAELIGAATVPGGGVDLLAARSAACAVDVSLFDLGDVENNWVRRFGLIVEFLIGMPPFSEAEKGKDGGFVEEELLEKGFVGRRGIARL
jgi:hypothetical protein